MEVVRSSPLFREYMDLAQQYGFQDEANVARQLVFVCSFNMSAGISRFLLPSMSAISINEQVRAKMVRELNDWDSDYNTVLDLPYLNAVLYECMRLYPWPRFIHKKAHRDFVLPAENGRSYQIYKGNLLMSSTPLSIVIRWSLREIPSHLDQKGLLKTQDWKIRFSPLAGLKTRSKPMDVRVELLVSISGNFW